MKQLSPVIALLFCLAACSPEPAAAPATAPGGANETAAPSPPAPAPSPSAPATTPPAANVLALEGLGLLRIGEAVPAGSGWAERGAQISDECRTVSSPDFPGVYAIVEGGKARRITVGERSDVELIEGIGTGATEAEVRAAFPGFRETPHEYVEAPAKYLTAPNAKSGDPALRFEIGADGKISLIHIGTMPVLGYVEGCA
ncbi:MAG: hypothetical protein M3Q15_05915 [Pseudomonadota bacterium]|nr:hypothetical protein [Pseudomonadota bacterium]